MIAALIGAIGGLGLLLCATAISPYRRLQEVLNPKPAGFDIVGDRSPSGWIKQLFNIDLDLIKKHLSKTVFDRAWVRDLAGPDFVADLAVGGNTVERFGLDLAIKVIGVWAGVGLFRLLDPNFFLVSGPRPLLAAAVVAAIVIAGAISDVRTKARRRRREMLEAVASYVEFTRLAAQTQLVEVAMSSAARCGATWPFRTIDNVFAAAQRRNDPPYVGLAELGRTFDIPDLLELAGALEVAATEGTRIQDTLAAKSQSLRRRLTEEEVRDAESRTEQINIPLTGLGICVFVLVIAPALLSF